MQPLVFICVNGVLTRPGDAEGWTDRAVTWLQTQFPSQPVKAEKFEYASGVITRRLRQAARAAAIAKMVGYYHRAGFRLVLVGHSNGCDLIARVLELVAAPINSAHLFAAAAEGEDFARALKERRLGVLHLYGSRHDKALKLAALSRALLGWAGLGYGSLGREATEFVQAHDDGRVFDHSDHDFGHSDWWERGDNFERTMRQLVVNELELSP